MIQNVNETKSKTSQPGRPTKCSGSRNLSAEYKALSIREMLPFRSVIKRLLAIAGGWWVFHLALNRFLVYFSNTYRRMKRDMKLEVLININALIASAIICPMYYLSCMKLDTSIASRFEGYSDLCHYALLLHCGQCTYETTTYMFQQKGLEFYLHHALVLLNYIDVLKTGTMQYYAAKDGLVEGTNVPLCLVNLLRMFGRSSHPLYTVNGILLWASYIPLRLVNLPMMVYQWIQDLSTEEGKKKWRKNTTLAKYTAVPTTIILWILSCLWMKPITAGVLKAVAPYINDARKHLFR